jgi:hypothetical protein
MAYEALLKSSLAFQPAVGRPIILISQPQRWHLSFFAEDSIAVDILFGFFGIHLFLYS